LRANFACHQAAALRRRQAVGHALSWVLVHPMIQGGTFNVQRSTFNIQRSTFNIQRSTFNIQHSTFNVDGNNAPRLALSVQR